MSVLFSGTNQGSFVSTGQAETIQLPSGVDWMWVRNLTTSYAAGAGNGVEYYWQLGMVQGRGTIYSKTAVTDAITVDEIAVGEGFFLVNNTVNIPGGAVAVTGITNGNPPVVNTGSTAGLVDGSIVRIFDTVGALQLAGYDFTIDNIVADTSFELAYMAQIANANPGAGTYRRIPFNPYFYPSSRYITKITQDDRAIVTLSVTHNYEIGQKIRFVIPTVTATRFGMTELNGVEATIFDINQPDDDGVTNTITVDVDTTGFTAFEFPLTGSGPFTPAQVIPIGENTADALAASENILSDATENRGFFGITLQAGLDSPAGSEDDVIYWVAGISFSVDNEA